MEDVLLLASLLSPDTIHVVQKHESETKFALLSCIWQLTNILNFIFDYLNVILTIIISYESFKDKTDELLCQAYMCFLLSRPFAFESHQIISEDIKCDHIISLAMLYFHVLLASLEEYQMFAFIDRFIAVPCMTNLHHCISQKCLRF